MGYKTLLTHESPREAEATSNAEGIAAIQPPSSFHQAVELMPVKARVSVGVKLWTNPAEYFLRCSAFGGICMLNFFLKCEIRLCDQLCFAQY